MRVSEYIVQELIKRGVQRVYTLQGGYSMYLNDAVGHSSLTPVYCLSESGAAFAACGEAQYTKEMSILVITSGLAQTNALSGVASAYSDYLPVMVISGDVRSELILERDTKGLRQGGQQDVPIERIANSVTKWVHTVSNAKHVKYWFNWAWNLAMEEPRGPAWLNIPIDVQQAEL